MSAVERFARPRRIKAAHRRRWKCTTGSRLYANDNPYRYTDPTGMCTGTHICNPDGTAVSTGGDTTGTNGAMQGMIKAKALAAAQPRTQTVSHTSGVTAGATAVAGTLEQGGGGSILSAIGAKLLGVVGMALSLSGDTPLAKDQPPRKEYVIGEGMVTRVIPFATSIGADYYHGAPPGMPESGYMIHNRAWINSVMDEHGALINIGPERGREFYPAPTSPYYKMELEQIKLRNYPTIDVNIP